MPTANLKVMVPTEAGERQGLRWEYYLKLITNEITQCLNANGISYTQKNKILPQNEDPTKSVDITFKTNPVSQPIPNGSQGIYVYFVEGDPQSKRLATAISKNLRNIYSEPSNVKIFSNKPDEITQKAPFAPEVILALGYTENENDLIWVRENTEEIAQNIVMSLCEYFGLPFSTCQHPNIAVIKKDTTVFERPSLQSSPVGSLGTNMKIEVLGQWENWYVVGENGKLGYVPSEFIIL